MTASPAAVRYAPRRAEAEWLDGLAWAYRSPRFVALGHGFRVRTTDREVGRYVERLYRPMEGSGPAAEMYSIVHRGGRSRRPWTLFAGADRLLVTADPSHLLHSLERHINREVLLRSAGVTLVRAAAAARGGAAVLLPAAMGGGKTTLVAGLVMAGLEYLTDETVALDPVSGLVRPYPKPLSVARGSWETLAPLRPRLSPTLAAFARQRWQVPLHGVGEVSRPARPHLIVVPRYRAGAPTRFLPLTRSEAACELAGHTFDFRGAVERKLTGLRDAVRNCHCFRLFFGDLDAAVSTILNLLDDPRGNVARHSATVRSG